MEGRALGLAHFWAAGDAVTHGVAWLLLAMSVVSWYFILGKAWSAWRLRRSARAALEHFWAARSLDDAVRGLQAEDTEGVFAPLAARAVEAARMHTGAAQDGGVPLAAAVNREEHVVRTLRQEITRQSARLEGGLTVLASVGSTAPFVGLFGTVWGIYHALIEIAAGGQVLIDRVAGPVGEALIMTAAGLAVAIPAVLAYNAFTRVNRVALAELDGFAHDLLALVTTGSRAAGRQDQLKAQAPELPATRAVGH